VSPIHLNARVLCRIAVLCGCTLAVLVTAAQVHADDKPSKKKKSGGTFEDNKGIQWTEGPGTLPVGIQAQIKIPEGYIGTGPEGTRRILELSHNPTDGGELAMLTAAGPMRWWIDFRFEDCGYVKDDEKAELDADAILKAIGKGIDAGNLQRKSRGWEELTLIGWEVPPKYNESTHNLEWATRLRAKGGDSINYNCRVLGRHGVMHVNLVCDPDVMQETLPEFEKLIGGFSYIGGESYAEFRSGDKVAEYGLTALIAGGALAAGLKFGILQKLWKFIVIGVVAVVGACKRLIGRLLGRGNEATR